MEIYKGNQTYTISLLEDLHRFFNKFPPRPTGEKYHQDGPFLGIFTDDSLNISRIDAKSPYNSKSCFMSPSRNNSFSKSFLHTRNPSPISPFLNSPFQHPVEASFDNISPKVKRIKKANFLGFEWLKKIKINLPKNLDLTGEKISEFRSGELLGRILEKIEAKDIHGLQKTQKKTGAAVKNVSLVFELLRKKPIFSTQLYYIERHILDGNGHYIRLLLKEIYRIYKNSIITLVKFSNGKV